MPPNPAETLREINAHLRRALVSFRPERRHCSTITQQDFAAIMELLLRVAPLRERGESSPEFEKELRAYRDNLEALQRTLPDLEVRLKAEKARLETTRSHLASAAIWVEASKTTL